MRIAIVSDVHANLQALDAVLRHAEQQQALDAVWALGDLVGYGPQPVECLARLRGLSLQAVAGNHDLASIGAIDTHAFNRAAATANAWNAAQLGDDERAFLTGLPLTLELGEMALAHGSLRAPVWEYMITVDAAITQFERMTTPFSLVGHTHVPLVFELEENALLYWKPEDREVLELGERRLIVNPGGVGQPRDGDPRAAYAVFDTDERSITFHRVSYDIKQTQKLIRAAGLPRKLAERLARGR